MNNIGSGNGDHDARLQDAAERAERLGLAPGANPAVDRYRLVMRAMRQPLAAQLPADFAARIAARIVLPEERGSVEDWLVSVLLLAVGVAGLLYLQPVMADVLASMHFALPKVPWPLLVASGIAVAVALAVDWGVAQLKR